MRQRQNGGIVGGPPVQAMMQVKYGTGSLHASQSFTVTLYHSTAFCAAATLGIST